jgi:hypothetical protein
MTMQHQALDLMGGSGYRLRRSFTHSVVRHVWGKVMRPKLSSVLSEPPIGEYTRRSSVVQVGGLEAGQADMGDHQCL